MSKPTLPPFIYEGTSERVIPRPEKRGPKPRKRIKAKGRKGSKTSKRRQSRKALRVLADKLFSDHIRERDGWECRVCRSTKQITCGHLVSREYGATRWDPQNAVAQCWPCNVKAKWDQLWWEAWIEERFPGRLALLKARARAGGRGYAKANLEEIVEALREGGADE